MDFTNSKSTGLIIILFKYSFCNNITPFWGSFGKSNLGLFSESMEDLDYENFLDLTNSYAIWFYQWNGSSIPNIEDSLLVFNEIEPSKIGNLLNKEGAQKSLFNNVWLIHSKNVSIRIEDYFPNNRFKIGINAQAYFVISSNRNREEHMLTQILGLGSAEIFYKVSILFIYHNFLIIYHIHLQICMILYFFAQNKGIRSHK